MCQNDNRYSLHGITSFGDEGCTTTNNKPTVFTRVDKFVKWICDKTGGKIHYDSGIESILPF